MYSHKKSFLFVGFAVANLFLIGQLDFGVSFKPCVSVKVWLFMWFRAEFNDESEYCI